MADASTALWVKNVRRRAGFASQAALADAMGVTRGAIGNWETGRGVPSMAHAERFAAVTRRNRSEVLAKFGYPIGGGEPVSQTAAALPAEWLAAIRAEIAAGVADGMAQLIQQLRDEGLLPAADTRLQRPPRRRSA
ncbi:MAG TPA: helix-turn-helix transcriptional regulator [Gaiellaceae bacterium]|nr:helix-turn-helix transcriptional regulator [Gaiellaceae bacterium]